MGIPTDFKTIEGRAPATPEYVRRRLGQAAYRAEDVLGVHEVVHLLGADGAESHTAILCAGLPCPISFADLKTWLAREGWT